MRWIWKNGCIKEEKEATVSIYDSAMLFGDCVFEMTRSFNGKQFKLREHLERLFRSAKHVRTEIPYTIEQLEQACLEIQEKNSFEFKKDDEHRLMINVTRGILPMYSATGAVGTNVIISDFPLRWTVAGMGKLFECGINAVTPSQRAIPAYLLDPKVKNRSRLHYLMANIEVSGYEGDNNWPLLLDTDGYVTESTGANFFISESDLLATSKSNNVLDGISKKYIMEMVGCYECDLDLYEVHNAEEAFVTATPFCMLPVVSINGQDIGNGVPGPIYKQLLREWSDKVEVDIKAQIQSWDESAKGGPSAYKFK